MKPKASLRRALADRKLLGTALAGASWQAWRVLLIAAVGEHLTDAERVIFKQLTGRDREPGFPVHELVAIVGRRGGKSRAMAVLLCWLAGLRDHRGMLAPGETGIALCVSRDQKVARVILDYVEGTLQQSPFLRRLIRNRTAHAIELSNRISIEVRPCDFRTLRGPSYVAIVGDEVAFWDTVVDFANPDIEVLAACRPGLMTTHGPLLLVSSAYAQSGVVFDAFRRDYGPHGTPGILVAWGTSRDFNPSLSQTEIDRELERDPVRNRAEYLSEFRVDVEGFIPREAIEACVGDYRELEPRPGVHYHCFIDAASGSDGGDSYAIAISHKDGDQIVIDAVREVIPPFSAAEVVTNIAVPLCKQYGGITKVWGDNFAGEFAKEPFRNAGIFYELHKQHKSELYRDPMLPLINSRKITLPRIDRLINQACTLERSTKRNGRDEITHPPHGHDDLINAAAGAAAVARRVIEQHVPLCAPIVVSAGPRYIPGNDGPRVSGGWNEEPIRDGRTAHQKWADWYYRGGGGN
jgi:hypothetical protein